MSDIKGPVILIVRDGWGYAEETPAAVEQMGNAVAMAHTPNNDRMVAEHPHTLMDCSGEEVGLPRGQMGNSEVGHLNLGAGRIVFQDITRIDASIRNGEFYANPAFSALLDRIAARQGRLHLIGLVSDGGVHSQLDHLLALIELAAKRHVPVEVHCVMDGRDTSPTSGAGYVAQVQAQLQKLGAGWVATVSGRYYTMDRDKRWERTEKGYRAIVQGQAEEVAQEPVAAIQAYYAKDVTDEFLPATVIKGYEGIRPGDGIIFFNFRADRARQLTTALISPDFNAFPRTKFESDDLVTMTQYFDTPTNPVAFPPQSMSNLLTDVLAANGKTQLRIAETEKYAHVTYFFNGGEEEARPGEQRCLVPSPKVATYDLKPEMSAYEVTDKLLEIVEKDRPDFVLVNYANADMVGHTAIIPAAIKAVETVDECVGRVLALVVDKLGGAALVTADHGNAEQEREPTGAPFTAHTTNPVQVTLVAPNDAGLKLRHGKLADIAPTVLDLMGLAQPAEMTGTSLIER